MVEELEPGQLRELLKNKAEEIELVDVRDPMEYEQLRIKGSRLIPLSTIMSRTDEIDWSKKVIFICRSGNRSGMAARAIAANHGRPSSNLKYGLQYCLNEGGSEYLETGRGAGLQTPSRPGLNSGSRRRYGREHSRISPSNTWDR